MVFSPSRLQNRPRLYLTSGNLHPVHWQYEELNQSNNNNNNQPYHNPLRKQ